MIFKNFLRKLIGAEDFITSVNGVKPDAAGNVNVTCFCDCDDEESIPNEEIENLMKNK